MDEEHEKMCKWAESLKPGSRLKIEHEEFLVIDPDSLYREENTKLARFKDGQIYHFSQFINRQNYLNITVIPYEDALHH